MKNTIKRYLLNNMETTRDVVNELNWYNNCLDFLEVYYMEDLDEYLNGFEPTTILNKMFYGDFNPNNDYFKFNVYGNLESYNDWELREEYEMYMDEIIEALLNNMDYIEIHDDKLKEMLIKYRFDIDEKEF